MGCLWCRVVRWLCAGDRRVAMWPRGHWGCGDSTWRSFCDVVAGGYDSLAELLIERYWGACLVGGVSSHRCCPRALDWDCIRGGALILLLLLCLLLLLIFGWWRWWRLCGGWGVTEIDERAADHIGLPCLLHQPIGHAYICFTAVVTPTALVIYLCLLSSSSSSSFSPSSILYCHINNL